MRVAPWRFGDEAEQELIPVEIEEGGCMKLLNRFAGVAVVVFLILAVTESVLAAQAQKILPSAVKPKVGQGQMQVVPAAKPDLSVGNMQWSNTIHQGDRIGHSSILNIVVQNIGDAPSPATQYRISCVFVNVPTPTLPELSGIRQLPPIEPGKSMGIAWPDASNNTWLPGEYRFTIELDPMKKVVEKSESNNTKSITMNAFATQGATSPPVTHTQTGGKIVSPLKRKAINPQPEPPGKLQN
jgi:hypothetical protein